MSSDETNAEDRYQQLGIGPRWVRRSLLQAAATEQGEIVADTIKAATDITDVVIPPTTLDLPLDTEPTANPPSPSASVLLPDHDISTYDWETLENTVTGCQRCPLASKRTQTVFGMGDKQARLMIVGEAPGAEEDRQGKPFVGQAGKLLDNMLIRIALSREQGVFIANVLKCRPPQNRNPQKDEINCCSPYLFRQIALIQPDLILAVGRYAINTLLQTEAPISSLRGRLHHYAGIPVIVTYHPAYLLRNLPDKFKAWQDMLFVKKTLAQSIR